MKKFTAQIKKIRVWIAHQFKAHTLRSVAITVAVVAVIVAGVLFAITMFAVPKLSYLPDRPFIIAEDYAKTPETLDELLHSRNPDAEALFQRPEIAKELLAAENVLDIAYSRYTLNNLRILRAQMAEMLAEPEDAYYLPDMEADEEMPPRAETALLSGTVGGAGAYTLTAAAPYAAAPYAALNAYELRAEHIKMIELCRNKINTLLTPETYPEPVECEPYLAVHAIWEDGQAVLHLTPVDAWLPQDGFKIYRAIGIGEPELIAKGVAATSKILSGEVVVTLPEVNGEVYDYEDASLDTRDIRDLYRQAELNRGKLEAMGLVDEALGLDDEAAFRRRIYVTDRPPAGVAPEKGGVDDYEQMIEEIQTIRTGL